MRHVVNFSGDSTAVYGNSAVIWAVRMRDKKERPCMRNESKGLGALTLWQLSCRSPSQVLDDKDSNR